MDNKLKTRYFFTFMVGLVIAIVLVIAPFGVYPDKPEATNWAIAKTLLSVITLPIVVVGFFIVQYSSEKL